MPRYNLPLPELTEYDLTRILSRIDHKSPNECWEWFWGTRNGYGAISIKDQVYNVTRLMYKIAFNVDPGPLFVLHRCDNPPCCNPRHFFLGDNKANALDAVKKGIITQGEGNGMSVLTDEAVIDIRKYKDKYYVYQLADIYGVSSTTISRIINGKTWKHIS